MADLLETIRDAVCGGRHKDVGGLVEQARGEGQPAVAILNGALVRGLEEAGQRFESGEFFLPNLLMAAKAVSAGIAVIQEQLAAEGAVLGGSGTFVIGTVRGDVHNIGKNIVSALLEASGFRVIDLGVDVKPEAFADAALAHQADIIGISALMTTTMIHQQRVMDVLEERGVRGRFKVMVGGAPMTASWCQRIGADDFATDAISGVKKARRLMER